MGGSHASPASPGLEPFDRDPASPGPPRSAPLRSTAPPAALAGLGAIGLAGCGVGTEGAMPASDSPATGDEDASAVTKETPRGAVRMSEAQAVRFLSQASFGADDASIRAVVDRGFRGWMEHQFTLAPTRHEPYVRASFAAFPKLAPKSNHVMDTFWKQAITGSDLLRQRVVYALTQIFVVSASGNNAVKLRPRGLASYLDMLGAHCFGNFRELLEAVTLHPIMGLYLSALGNMKEDPSTGRVPDENFARELMQLFTIGLHRLRADGSLERDGLGRPIPTYSNEDVQGLARVFTGWSWAGPDTSDQRFSEAKPSQQPDRDVEPMQPYPQFHSAGEKRFLGVTIPAGTDARTSLRIALDTLFNHPNVGPFFARQLIQRLVTSNPSPRYVAKVAAAFDDNGRGVRGDMKAVLRAVLLGLKVRSTAATETPHWGKLCEPVLRLAAWARAFGATSVTGNFTIRDVGDPATALGQNPLRAPSVFNFFRPGHVPPGTDIARAGLVAPEFQITGESSVAGYLNFMRRVVDTGVGSNALTLNDVRASYTTEVGIAADAARLIDRIALLLTADQMTDATRALIRDAVASIPLTARDAALNRVKLAVYLTLACPEFLVQR